MNFFSNDIIIYIISYLDSVMVIILLRLTCTVFFQDDEFQCGFEVVSASWMNFHIHALHTNKGNKVI